MSRIVTRIAVVAAVVTGLGAVGVAALGLTSSASTTSAPIAAGRVALATDTAGYPSEGDYCYIEAMIPHHAQALELSEAVLAVDGVRDRTRALAEYIRVDQAREIDEMTQWRDAWLRALPETTTTGHGAHAAHSADADQVARGCGHAHDHSGMQGMATPEQLEALSASSGTHADALFLHLMMVHHEGALVMATEAVTSTSNAYIRSSGKHVLVEQEREIAAMNALLEELE